MFIALAETAPPPVPDGQFAGSAMLVSWIDSSNQLKVQWDVTTCGAAGYNLFYGDLDNVAAMEVLGASCSWAAAFRCGVPDAAGGERLLPAGVRGERRRELARE